MNKYLIKEIETALNGIKRLNPKANSGTRFICELGVKGKRKKWIQAELNLLNMDSPFETDPLEKLKDLKNCPDDIMSESFKAKLFTTYSYSEQKAEDLAIFLYLIFTQLYGQKEDFDLTVKIEKI